jgi:hypothetical protein
MAQDFSTGLQPAGRSRRNRHRLHCLVTWRREMSVQMRSWSWPIESDVCSLPIGQDNILVSFFRGGEYL